MIMKILSACPICSYISRFEKSELLLSTCLYSGSAENDIVMITIIVHSVYCGHSYENYIPLRRLLDKQNNRQFNKTACLYQ